MQGKTIYDKRYYSANRFQPDACLGLVALWIKDCNCPSINISSVCSEMNKKERTDDYYRQAEKLTNLINHPAKKVERNIISKSIKLANLRYENSRRYFDVIDKEFKRLQTIPNISEDVMLDMEIEKVEAESEYLEIAIMNQNQKELLNDINKDIRDYEKRGISAYLMDYQLQWVDTIDGQISELVNKFTEYGGQKSYYGVLKVAVRDSYIENVNVSSNHVVGLAYKQNGQENDLKYWYFDPNNKNVTCCRSLKELWEEVALKYGDIGNEQCNRTLHVFRSE